MRGDEIHFMLDPEGGPVWDTGSLRVTVERGRYLPDAGFQSFEDTWQARNPGIPAHVAANAIRVRIERRSLAILLSPYGRREYSLAAAATAVKGETEPVCVAPFALPVCALLSEGVDDDGKPTAEFDSGAICSADRIFTRADRFCPAGTDPSHCPDILPEFFWYPTNSLSSSGSPGRGAASRPNPPSVIRADPTCSWGNPTFPEISDHFGVVGLPSSAGVVTEEKIRNVILDSGPTPSVPARLGEGFSVLGDGLVERASDRRRALEADKRRLPHE